MIAVEFHRNRAHMAATDVSTLNDAISTKIHSISDAI